jgi:heat shock protein HslJ
MAAAGFKAAFAAALLTGCVSVNATNATFEGTTWSVVSINGARTPPYLIRFSRSRISGVICNRFGGIYSASHGVMQLGGIKNTERGCSGPIMQFEESAFAVLRRAMRLHWESGRRLTLSNSAGSIELMLAR